MGSVSFFLGMLARLLGRPRDAAGHFEDALAMNERMAYAPQVARTQVAFAELLADGGRSSDRQRATTLLACAEATARRLEMAPVMNQIDRSRLRLERSVSSRPPARARG